MNVELYAPAPTPNAVRQAILNQRIPGQDGMTVGDAHQIALKATEQAGKNLEKVVTGLDPTGTISVALIWRREIRQELSSSGSGHHPGRKSNSVAKCQAWKRPGNIVKSSGSEAHLGRPSQPPSSKTLGGEQ